MNEVIRKLALDAHLINYIDNETPRRYFISGDADVENVQRFAEFLVNECARTIQEFVDHRLPASEYPDLLKKYWS